MIGPLQWLLLAVLLLFGVAATYWLLANRWLRQWIGEGEARPSPSEPLPPITFLRPLKRNTPRLVATLETLVQAMRPGDQLLLGLEVDSEALVVCEELRSRFPERDIELVR